MSEGGYDPELRRETPLAGRIRAIIRAKGPLPVERYMDVCLTDAEHGYYRRRLAIGASSDFITAPEISQVFGELIGLWAAVVWQQMGSPSRMTLAEFGPGRGTMMADALRATARVPGFAAALGVVLIEPNETLRPIQAATLAGFCDRVQHVDPGALLPDGPLIVVANEMLDCLPVSQVVKVAQADGSTAWQQRVVILDDDGRLQFGFADAVHEDRGALPLEHPAKGRRPLGTAASGSWDASLAGCVGAGTPRAFPDAASPGSIWEVRNFSDFAGELERVAADAPLAALFIDYGHADSGTGDTLQAVREHRPEHPLTSPGEADLTAQVDFAAFAAALREGTTRTGAALAIDGPITQAEFLGRLGIIERASRLMAANPDRAGVIEAGIARLLSPIGMGTRFKAIGIRSCHLPILPGFEGAP